MSENPLLQPFRTPHETVPFNQIQNEHFLPALEEALAAGRREIATIADRPEPPTFENTLVALERSGELVSRVSSVMYNLNHAETNPELQKIVRNASPLLTEYSNDTTLNEALFARIKAVYERRHGLDLDAEDQMLLERTYKSFARNGANLSPEAKERFREIDRELAQLALEFGEHILNETNDYVRVIADEADLAGLPEFVREMARQTAQQKGREGWAFTLQAPSYVPFMQYADNRDLRRELFVAYNSRGYHGDGNDNQEILQKIVQLRFERAALLGYPTHADFVLEESMAGSAGKVTGFLRDLVGHAKPKAEEQLDALTTYARANGFAGEKLQRWDYSYYAEKLKKEQYSLDDEMLKPYFELGNVLAGIFTVADKLFGLTFRENADIPVYHPEVKPYEVFDDQGGFIAVFYGDYFPREGKRSGAWMNDIRGQKIVDGKNIRPHIVNVCNFTRPTDTRPSLLTFNEVVTLFHEFGHALHGMLANGKYESLTGTNVYRDFVELPSQLMENWCYEPEVLRLFARHYQTGEVIPQELVDRIRESQNFMEGVNSLTQLRYGLVDMQWHGHAPAGASVVDVERQVDAQVSLFPRVEGTAFSPAFSHIFAGGYAAGYYSYKWSEVLDADAFEYFQEQGLFNREVAGKFRRYVLEKGGSEHPMELYKKFRGREPSPRAMLRRSGLVVE